MPRYAIFIVMVLMLVGLVGCSQEAVYDTPEAALTEFPGFLQGGDKHAQGTEQILHRVPMEGGVVLIYRWQDKATLGKATHCVGATWVKQVDGGWRAESSTAPDLTCDYNLQQDFVVSEITLDGRRLLYGLHPTAQSADVTWTDGEVSAARFEQGVFTAMRDTIDVALQEVTVFDATGASLPSDYRDGTN